MPDDYLLFFIYESCSSLKIGFDDGNHCKEPKSRDEESCDWLSGRSVLVPFQTTQIHQTDPLWSRK